MPTNLKFPPSAEIKRAIAAAQRVGIEIGSIEIHPRKIIIFPVTPTGDHTEPMSAYDQWKMSEQKNSPRVRHVEGKSDALRKKPRG